MPGSDDLRSEAQQEEPPAKPLEDQKVDALTRSLAELLETLTDREEALEKERRETKRLNEELRRARRKLNDVSAEESNKMMDVAMEASVQAIQMLAQQQAEQETPSLVELDREGARRWDAERVCLAKELKSLELLAAGKTNVDDLPPFTSLWWGGKG
jgi:chromosome segregation ATPase